MAELYKQISDEGASIQMPTTKLPDKDLIAKYLEGVTSKAEGMNPKMGACMKIVQPFIVLPIQLVMCLAPFYTWFYQWVAVVYKVLPQNAITALFGLALCFFGGTYVASIAAIEAFRQMGFEKVLSELSIVMASYEKVQAANAKDDTEDADGDGVADVMQIQSSELVQRKLFLGMRAVEEPERLQAAVGSLWASYIAVLATLKLEFARTTAFALGIVEVVKFPVVRFFSPLLIPILMNAPESIRLPAAGAQRWGVTIVESSLTLIAVAFAWYLQMIISAFYSGLKGGKMFADAVLQMAMDYDMMKYLPFIEQPFNADESFVDEAIGYSVAFFGFSFQFFSGFQLPFPFNIIFLPLSIIEWFLRIQISFSGSGVH